MSYPGDQGKKWQDTPLLTLQGVGQGEADPVAEAGGEVQLGAAARAGRAEAEASPHQRQHQHRSSSRHGHAVACCMYWPSAVI